MKHLLFTFMILFASFHSTLATEKETSILTDSITPVPVNKEARTSRFTLGGYGEVALTRNFYSDEWQRYTNAEKYRNAKSHGRLDRKSVV